MIDERARLTPGFLIAWNHICNTNLCVLHRTLTTPISNLVLSVCGKSCELPVEKLVKAEIDDLIISVSLNRKQIAWL